MTSGPGIAPPRRQEREAEYRGKTAMTDAQLVEQFATQRDEAAEEAFEVLIARHGPMVLGVCRHMLGNTHDAEDAFQATFLVLMRKAGTIRVEESLGNWLYGVAYKVAARARAGVVQRHWHESRSAAMTSATSDGEPTLRDLEPILHEELNRLPTKYRAPVVLCYLEGLTHDEAAERLGWPLGTVKGRLARARDLLRGRLSRRGITRSAGLVLALFAPEATSSAMPEGLAKLTARAAMQTSTAEAAAAGAASTPAAALADAVVRAMVVAKVKIAVAVVMAVGAVTIGADLPPILPPRAQAQEALADDVPGPAPEAAIAPAEGNSAIEADHVPARDEQRTSAVPIAESPAALAAYNEARVRVGRDPEAHVRLALWCEAHGLQAERLKHLAIALLNDPTCASARGLMGLVAYQGRWQRPETITEGIRADAEHSAVLAEYNARRARTPNTSSGQWRLALWCEQQGLNAEAQAHCSAVTRLDPTHEAAWKRLDCRRWNGRWMTETQI
ncbi:MAG TPA: RNA polymerase sigma factor, partial [Isosphaeraceae bacterium]|nr:RNA polymerase sigma factor [Isosphaeraceae bacterium]